jgi:hypothetical protein
VKTHVCELWAQTTLEFGVTHPPQALSLSIYYYCGFPKVKKE